MDLTSNQAQHLQSLVEYVKPENNKLPFTYTQHGIKVERGRC